MQIETQMIETVPVVRFDWALKHLLRDEKNIPLFNHFLTALFPRKVEVIEILKSDYADDEPNDCYGKLNLLARYTNGEVFVVNLVAICSDRFMPIFLNLSARAVQDNNLSKGEQRQIYPVVSVAIVYSAQDDSMAQVDCVFYGKTGFEGAPWEEPLLLKDSLCYNPNRVRKASAFFPQYYVLKLQDFRNYCARHLDHWIRMMAYCEWYVDSPIPGIDQAGELLAVDGLSADERAEYEKYIKEHPFEYDAWSRFWPRDNGKYGILEQDIKDYKDDDYVPSSIDHQDKWRKENEDELKAVKQLRYNQLKMWARAHLHLFYNSELAEITGYYIWQVAELRKEVDGFDLQSHLKYCHDAEGRLASVYREVIEPAYREGYELEGRKITKRIISSLDLSDEDIARIVGMTEEEVAELRVEVEGEGSKD